MTTEWIELPTLVSVCNAQADGLWIQVYDDYDKEWIDWAGEYWSSEHPFRARPRQPKMKKVKMLCYFSGRCLTWLPEDHQRSHDWIRIPAQDIEIEIPEGV